MDSVHVNLVDLLVTLGFLLLLHVHSCSVYICSIVDVDTKEAVQSVHISKRACESRKNSCWVSYHSASGSEPTFESSNILQGFRLICQRCLSRRRAGTGKDWKGNMIKRRRGGTCCLQSKAFGVETC